MMSTVLVTSEGMQYRIAGRISTQSSVRPVAVPGFLNESALHIPNQPSAKKSTIASNICIESRKLKDQTRPLPTKLILAEASGNTVGSIQTNCTATRTTTGHRKIRLNACHWPRIMA